MNHAIPTGPSDKIPALSVTKNEDVQDHAKKQTKLLNMYAGGRRYGSRRRRKSRKKRRRRRRRSRKRRGGDVVTIDRLGDDLIAKLPPKAKAKALPFFSKINEIISSEGNWIDGQKIAAGGRRRQCGGSKKTSKGTEDSLCGSYQTPDERQFTSDKYIVVPQPSGGSEETTINLAKTLTQAKANSEGDFSVVDTVFQDDSQKTSNLRGGRKHHKRKKKRRSRKKKHRRGSHKKKYRHRSHKKKHRRR